MAYSNARKRLFVQKAVWVRKDIAQRLKKIIKARKKAKEKFSEHIAFALALRAFVELEEQTLGIVYRPKELIDSLRKRQGGDACPPSSTPPQ